MSLTVLDYAELLERMNATVEAAKPKRFPFLEWSGSEVAVAYDERQRYVRTVDCAAEPWFETFDRLRDVLRRAGAPTESVLQLRGFTLTPMFVIKGNAGEIARLAAGRKFGIFSIGKRHGAGWRRTLLVEDVERELSDVLAQLTRGRADMFLMTSLHTEVIETLDAVLDDDPCVPLPFFDRKADDVPFAYAHVSSADSRSELRKCFERVAAHLTKRLGEPAMVSGDPTRGAVWPHRARLFGVWENGELERYAIDIGFWDAGPPPKFPPNPIDFLNPADLSKPRRRQRR